MEDRYERQIRLADFGPSGQQALSGASVLIVGAGGLGIPAAQYLNAMGVGRLGLVDGDVVETSNLHRQPAYGPGQVGKSKIAGLAAWLRNQNPDTQIDLFDTFLNPANALECIGSFDLVLDATDNLPTRYLLDDACLILGTPWIYGALHGFEGQVSVFNYRGGPTYRCLFPDPPTSGEIPDCDTLGTLGVLPGIIGNLQALEAVKVLCSLDGICSGRLLIYNALDQEMQQISFSRDPNRQAPEDLATSYQLSCKDDPAAVSGAEYRRLRRDDLPHILVDVREPDEFDGGHLEGAWNFPLDTLAEKSGALTGTAPVYLICETGPRSRRACQLVRKSHPEAGVFWIAGGMRQYKVETT